MKTTATTEAVSSPPEETEFWNTNRRRNTTCAGQKLVVDWKNACKFREKAENHENHPCRSWALNHMGNPRLNVLKHTIKSEGPEV